MLCSRRPRNRYVVQEVRRSRRFEPDTVNRLLYRAAEVVTNFQVVENTGEVAVTVVDVADTTISHAYEQTDVDVDDEAMDVNVVADVNGDDDETDTAGLHDVTAQYINHELLFADDEQVEDSNTSCDSVVDYDSNTAGDSVIDSVIDYEDGRPHFTCDEEMTPPFVFSTE